MTTASQKLPDPGRDYSDFPDRTAAAGATMYRAHSFDKSAWWFDNGDGGRFNLHGDRGTCCTAATVDTAVREKVRDAASESMVVDAAYADSFVVSAVTAPLPYRLAAVSSTPAARHGVVRALVTMEDYTVPQAWAEAFDRSGFDGVFYGSAYTTGPASAYALFGRSGAPESAGYTASVRLRGREACREVGFTVAGMPRASAFRRI